MDDRTITPADNKESFSRPSTSQQGRPRLQPRRASASPRILELANRYEPASPSQSVTPKTTSGTRRASVGAAPALLPIAPTIRMGLGGMNWHQIPPKSFTQLPYDHSETVRGGHSSNVRVENPLRPSPASPVLPSVRKVDAQPVQPLGNLAFNFSRLGQKQVDGLPHTEGSTIPIFPEEEMRPHASDVLYRQPLLDSSPTLPRPSSADEEDDENTRDESTLVEDEQKPLVDDPEEDDDDDETFLSRGSSTLSTHLQPFPAHEVFAKDAYPLHLPHLDYFLANNHIFAPPHFSNAEAICSEEEKELFGYNIGSSNRRALEVCGAQLKVPVEVSLPNRHQQVIKRLNVGEQEPVSEEGDHELKLLSNENGPRSPALVNFKQESGSASPPKRPDYGRGYSGVTSSTMSTASRPKSRLDKFPPLMLLDQSSLDELKSNAVGPRKPPGGFLGFLPGIGSILGTIVDFVIGVEGSTLAAGIFRLQLFIDFVQITNLNLYLVKPVATNGNAVNKTLLSTIPSLLALDLVSVFGYAVIILMAWIAIVAVILLYFLRMTRMYNPNRLVEGYNSQPWLFRPFRRDKIYNKTASLPKAPAATPSWKSTPWTKFQNVMIVMSLTVLYIPLGKLAFDALVWNVDYWPLDAQSKLMKADTSQHTGDPDLWRGPLDYCYTTTMRKDQFNWAFPIVGMAALTIIFYILWFPFQMRRTISTLLPRVPEYNELGNKRSKDDIDSEYIKLLKRDSSPLNFMYNAYKREWGNYKPLYLLLFKFSNMFIISIFTQDNCLWRKFEAKTMLVTQEGVLIGVQTILLVIHVILRPFIDDISNRSELVSRSGYVIDGILGLLVALQVKDYTLYNTWVLYIVYVFTYSGNIYFALAGTSWMSHLFKKAQSRIDFSVDIFSPFLRLEMHVKRRIWQETLSSILLSGREYHMPLNQLVTFSVQPNCPPYLLAFQGTAAERHVENLKILRMIGIDEYRKSVETLRGEDKDRWKWVMKQIQLDHAGVDAYWKPHNGTGPQGVSSFFGKAFLIPFPPTLMMKYDQTPEEDMKVVTLNTLPELEMFIWQNKSEVIQRRKWVRSVLRALDGQRVYCPHVEAVKFGSNMSSAYSSILSGGRRQDYTLAKPVFYSEGVFNIQRKAAMAQEGYNFHSGFEVTITYEYGQRRDADGVSVIKRRLIIDGAAAFGLRDDFEWSTSVQRFFHANNEIIQARLDSIKSLLGQYRFAFYTEAREKRKAMGYSFLLDVFENPALTISEVVAMFRQSKSTTAVRQLPETYPATTKLLLERLNHLARSPLHQWWYLFWDDLWRQNHLDYKSLSRHKRVFSPQFPSSIAWTPMPRHHLESLLKSKSGVWSGSGRRKKKTIFHSGLLNQIYFTLDDLACNQPNYMSEEGPVLLGLADRRGTIDTIPPSAISSNPFSRLTGGGTNHDDGSIMNRHAWPWTEERLSGKARGGIVRKIQRFLAIDPYIVNDNIKDIWIFARLTNEGSGEWRYEAEKRKKALAKTKQPLSSQKDSQQQYSPSSSLTKSVVV